MPVAVMQQPRIPPPVFIQRDPERKPLRALVPEERGWYDVVVLLEKEGWYAMKGETDIDESGVAMITLINVRPLTKVERLRPFVRIALRVTARLLERVADSF